MQCFVLFLYWFHPCTQPVLAFTMETTLNYSGCFKQWLSNGITTYYTISDKGTVFKNLKDSYDLQNQALSLTLYCKINDLTKIKLNKRTSLGSCVYSIASAGLVQSVFFLRVIHFPPNRSFENTDRSYIKTSGLISGYYFWCSNSNFSKSCFPKTRDNIPWEMNGNY